MCGIAGACWSADGQPLSVDELARMLSVLVHRGPDDSGMFHSSQPHPRLVNASAPTGTQWQADGARGGAALGQRRLSIIDLAGGHQPLSNEDGTVWITFNGEIYNYRELRPQLERQGHRFHTSSDTETIVHLYEEYGDDCVHHLRGMFAFAVWDGRRRRLFFARDRIGKKPLFYREEQGRLLFASELKALLQVPGTPRTLDVRALDDYLAYQYVPHPRCILEGFAKLPPAHRGVYENGRLMIERYWQPPYALDAGESAHLTLDPRETRDWPEAKWRAELRQRLTDAVRLRMRSDVPLGAFLSGGIDSTIIAGLMQQLSETRVHTFSIGFPVKQFDETEYARAAARHLKTQHHEQQVNPEALTILPKLIWHYDEPFADSSAIPTMYLSEMTRREVTVALSGDGGDELFAGYDRYRAVKLGEHFDRWPRTVQKLLTARVWQRLPSSVKQKSVLRRAKRLLFALGEPPQKRYLTWITIFDAARRRELYTNDVQNRLAGHDAADFLYDAYRACPERDFVTRTTCADVLTYLPCDILTKVDIASMAYSLECRCPFLDQHVVELAACMPVELKHDRGRWKKILVEEFADSLPPSIQKRGKMGFGVPLDHWFRNELKELLQDTLLDSRSLSRGYFEPERVRQLVQEHVAGKWDHTYRLWSLLVFEMWQRMYLDVAAPPLSPPTVI